MAILVTGGAGFIGSHLCESLLKSGADVVALDNFNDFYSPAIKRRNAEELRAAAREKGAGRFEMIEGDLRDEALIDRLAARSDVDQVAHLAAMAGVRPSIERPDLYVDVNVRGTLNLLSAMQAHGKRFLVFASTSSVYGENEKVPFSETDPVDHPISPYAATKRAGELMAHVYHRLFGLRVVCLRFFTVYGPRGRPDMAIYKFTRLIHEEKPLPFFGDGSTRRDYTYVADIIQGVRRALDFNRQSAVFEIVNLGESRTTTLSRLVQIIEAGLGKKAILEPRPVQPGDVPATYADITKARLLLGYDPHTPVEEGIPRFIAWFKTTV
ncbi:MAG: SDR family NAD(P)-dependent oxidoreductase [Planctomycetes bacterium]|nr:SDR family NAD(P)-dependent oxidoreductase [Planctomycetota bacterium]